MGAVEVPLTREGGALYQLGELAMESSDWAMPMAVTLLAVEDALCSMESAGWDVGADEFRAAFRRAVAALVEPVASNGLTFGTWETTLD